MTDDFVEELLAINNGAIFDSFAKAQSVLSRSTTALCSISGGSDSDIILDLIHRIDECGKVTYCWYDTGLEYEATKEHLIFLEQKYGIKIERIKAIKPIPTCVREYGVPFLSKYVSDQMMRLQRHGFQWEDEPYEVLSKKYPNCITSLKWWCNYSDLYENGKIKSSKFSISRNRWLKEFIIANPPDFPISDKCCEYTKKKLAVLMIRIYGADLEITGIRKAEGGIRSANYKTCFSLNRKKNCNTFRPVFWFTDNDKKIYEEHFGVVHNRCYTDYGMKRTGCVGCPFNPRVMNELKIIQTYEPKLYKAAVNIFGKSYEYTRKYREFQKEMKRKHNSK